MTRFYAKAFVWGRAFRVAAVESAAAVRRLAFYTDVLGDAVLVEYLRGIVDPGTREPFVYRDRLFLEAPSGAPPPSRGLPMLGMETFVLRPSP